MPVPKSVIKFDKEGVKYESSCDRAAYTLHELTRAALRDSGKYICRMFRQKYYNEFKKKKGNIGRYTQYWVKSKQATPSLQVGLKPNAFYGGFQEVGSSKQSKKGLLQGSVKENIAEIVKIQSQYLSSLEDETKALQLIKEQEYQGGADD